MSYTMYTPLNVWLDPASVADVVAYIQTYLRENTIYSETEIEAIIHDYLIAHPELIGGVQSVNGKTGTVVLSASDINTEDDVTIESVLASLSSQISSIAASVATNTNNITALTGRVSTAETDLSNLKSNVNTMDAQIDNEVTARTNADTALTNRINALQGAVGSPLIAATASAMTDTSKIYVYTGSETGYTNGNWYYYNGSSWVSGGVYNAVAINTDRTLTVSDMAADAKVTGDRLNSLNDVLTEYKNTNNINLLYPINKTTRTEAGVTFTFNGDFVTVTGTGTRNSFINLFMDYESMPIGINAGKTYNIKYSAESTPFRIYVYDSNRVSTQLTGTLKDVSITIPQNTVGFNARLMVVSGRTYNETIKIPFIYTNDSNYALRLDVDSLLESVPDYYFDNNYLQNKITTIDTIESGLSDHSARLFFLTDYHYPTNANNSPRLIKYLVDKTRIKKFAFGGDSINEESSKVLAIKSINEFFELFKSVEDKTNSFYITGNHDYNNPDSLDSTKQLSRSSLYQLFNVPNPSIHCIEDTNTFYYDDDATKIRYYFIDCEYNSSISTQSRDNVFQTMLDIPEGYAVLLISHRGLIADHTEIYSRILQYMNVCAALNDGTSYTIPYVDIGSKTYDFTGKARTFIGCLSGHTHLDGYIYFDTRFPVISTACDSYVQQTSHPERIAGTILEQCFDVVQIDVTAKRIYMTRIGFGDDRTFSFGDANSGLIT